MAETAHSESPKRCISGLAHAGAREYLGLPDLDPEAEAVLMAMLALHAAEAGRPAHVGVPLALRPPAS